MITINSACLPDKYGRQAELIVVQKNAILSTEKTHSYGLIVAFSYLFHKLKSSNDTHDLLLE